MQQHSKKLSKSCRKGGKECRFNFPKPPSCKAFITSPCEDEKPEESYDQLEERAKLQKSEAKNILLSIWDKLQSEEFDSDTTPSEILASVNISQEIYEKAMQLMSSKQSVVLKRNPNELWIIHYNPFLLECWNANMDIQFVLDPFSCIVYVVSYISKAEREMGMLLKQRLKLRKEIWMQSKQ